MLKQVSFENYRGFESYKLDGLARVNLLVGKNNSGKTAVLEGLQLHATDGDPEVVVEIANRRGEILLPKSPEYPPAPLVDISHFFTDMPLNVAVQSPRSAKGVA